MAATRPVALAGAFVARSLADDRPLWVYALRPFLTTAVWGAAAGYRLRQRADTGVAAKRIRRAVWTAWYESTQQVRRTTRRVSKPVKRIVRQVAGIARRVGRRPL